MSADCDASSSVRRHLIGASGLLCLAIGGSLMIWPLPASSAQFVYGMCIEAGLVLLAAWLALPQLDRIPGWLFATTLGLVLLVAVRPQVVLILVRVGVVLLPIFFAIWLLRPKSARQASRRSQR
jgi:hypothetical protein